MNVEIVLVKMVNKKYFYFKAAFLRLFPIMWFNSFFNVGRGEVDSMIIKRDI